MLIFSILITTSIQQLYKRFKYLINMLFSIFGILALGYFGLGYYGILIVLGLGNLGVEPLQSLFSMSELNSVDWKCRIFLSEVPECFTWSGKEAMFISKKLGKITEISEKNCQIVSIFYLSYKNSKFQNLLCMPMASHLKTSSPKLLIFEKSIF